MEAFFHSFYRYLLDTYYTKHTLTNKENQQEPVHKNKLIGNAKSKLCQIIKYFFKVYIYQIYGKLSSL